MNDNDIESELKKISSSYLLSYKKDQVERDWIFSLQGNNKVWDILLSFYRDFPNSLPCVKLLDQKDIGSLAHVNSKGQICIEASDSIIIDICYPSKVIEYYLQKIVETLDNASLKISQIELTNEYEGYFHFDSKDIINSFYMATEKLEHVSLQIVPANSKSFLKNTYYHNPVLLLNKKNEFPPNFSNTKQAHATCVNVIHLPLEIETLPPKNGEKITTQYIYKISHLLSKENQKRLVKLVKGIKQKKEFFLLISMPRSDVERSQLLLRFFSKDDLPHPLIEYSEQWDIDIFTIQRNHKEYLLERGGGEVSLLNKKVTIVGCGSVGGEIAYMLAKAGIGELTLIDNDNFSVDNIYRHRLGGNFLNYKPNDKGVVKQFSKVLALQISLQKDLPFIKVNAIKNLFENVMTENNIMNSNLIIIAVGSPALNLKLNRELKRLEFKNAVFCWNEAAGYGGHSVYVNFEKSCLECLYTYASGYSNICKLNFLEAGQEISKNLTGCAGVFTPFSYLDSSQTAILATKQSIQVLLGLSSDTKTVSWRGKGTYSLKTTPRHKDATLMCELNVEQTPLCKVCDFE